MSLGLVKPLLGLHPGTLSYHCSFILEDPNIQAGIRHLQSFVENTKKLRF